MRRVPRTRAQPSDVHAGASVVSTPIRDGCSCDRCANAKARETNSIFFAVMPLCPTCGNKRCPKGTDHDNECSGSNEPGQKGSIYE